MAPEWAYLQFLQPLSHLKPACTSSTSDRASFNKVWNHYISLHCPKVGLYLPARVKTRYFHRQNSVQNSSWRPGQFVFRTTIYINHALLHLFWKRYETMNKNDTNGMVPEEWASLSFNLRHSHANTKCRPLFYVDIFHANELLEVFCVCFVEFWRQDLTSWILAFFISKTA